MFNKLFVIYRTVTLFFLTFNLIDLYYLHVTPRLTDVKPQTFVIQVMQKCCLVSSVRAMTHTHTYKRTYTYIIIYTFKVSKV